MKQSPNDTLEALAIRKLLEYDDMDEPNALFIDEHGRFYIGYGEGFQLGPNRGLQLVTIVHALRWFARLQPASDSSTGEAPELATAAADLLEGKGVDHGS